MGLVKKVLSNGTDVFIYQSDLLKSTDIGLNFYTESNDKNEARSVLINILQEGSKKYKSKMDYELDLVQHNTEIYTRDFNLANLNFIEIGLETLTFRGLKENSNNLEQSLRIMQNCLYSPLAKNKKFYSKVFEKQKENIRTALNLKNENAQETAFYYFKETVFSDNRFILPIEDSLDNIDVLTQASAYDEYNSMLNKYPRFLLVATHLDVEEIMDLTEKAFGNLPKSTNKSQILINPSKNESAFIVEESDFSQTIAHAGCPLPTTGTIKENETLKILGNIANKKIWQSIRGKNELAYSAGALASQIKGLLYFYTGISAKDIDLTVRLMGETFSDLKQGRISKKEFIRSKKNLVLSHKKNSHMISSRLGSLYLPYLIGNLNMNQNYENKFKNVSYEDCLNLASKIENNIIIHCLREKND